jgi:hypothetical protein
MSMAMTLGIVLLGAIAVVTKNLVSTLRKSFALERSVNRNALEPPALAPVIRPIVEDVIDGQER